MICFVSGEEQKREDEKKQNSGSRQFPNRRRNMLVSGLVALTAMLGFALFNGLVTVSLQSF